MTRPIRTSVFALVGLPAILVAQSSTTSALTGVVRDAAGRGIPGATVRVSSPALIGGNRVVLTGDQGGYRLPALPPGRYRIVVEAPGLPTLTGNETLELGRTSTVNWRFQAAASATVEVISAGGTGMETTATGVSQNYSVEALKELPSASRGLSDFMNMTPGVNGGQAWGATSGSNAYLMDGVNVGDPSGGSQWIYPNPDWFDEIQVGGIGAPAEFGGFTGAFVNSVIKRGGNQLQGSFNGYYESSRFKAQTSNPDPRIPPGDRKNPEAKSYDYALNLGGPLVKDRVWYFLSAERIQQEDASIGALKATRIKSIKLLGKVTWAVTPTDTLEAFAEYDTLDEEYRGCAKDRLPIASVQEKSPSRSFNLTWTRVMGADKVLTLKALSFSGRYDLLPYNGQAAPLNALDLYNGVANFNNTPSEDRNYRARSSVLATFDWFRTGLISSGDSHAFKFGVEREQASDEELNRTPGGYLLEATTDGPDLVTEDYIAGGGWNIRIRLDRTAAFVQDSWTVNDRLTLRPGLRYEQFKGRAYGGNTLWSTSTLAPRLGVNVALTADQKSMVKLHWGRFFSGISTWFFDRTIPGAYPKERYYYWGNYDVIDPLDPSTWPKPDPSADENWLNIDSASRLDPRVRHPYVDETTLSLEHRFADPWAASLTYVHRKNRDILVQKDERPDPEGSWSRSVLNPLTGQVIPVYDTGLYGDGHDYLITNDARADRSYWSATLALERKFQGSWSLFASYTRAHLAGNITSIDGWDNTFASPNKQINFDGRLPGYHDDEIKVRGTWQAPWRMTFAGSFTYLSGQRWTPTISTPYLGPDGAFRGTIFAETRGAEKYPCRRLVDLRITRKIAFTSRVSLDVFIEGFNLLNDCPATAWYTRVNQNRKFYPGSGLDQLYSDYRYPTDSVAPRTARLGVRLSF